jgi:hypothetical protein
MNIKDPRVHAMLAILKVEPEALALIAVLSEAGVKWISTATLLETRLVVERQIGAAGQAELDRLLAAALPCGGGAAGGALVGGGGGYSRGVAQIDR